MSHVADFEELVLAHGQDLTFHREEGGTPCPCRTPEGFRDPAWHLANPGAPVCNQEGYLPVVTSFGVKGFVQPVTSVKGVRAEVIEAMFGEIQAGDHLGIFPLHWGGSQLNFENWSTSGEDYIQWTTEFFTKRFFAVISNLISDPDDGVPHHWECGLRLIGA